jgi:hypothetical protein
LDGDFLVAIKYFFPQLILNGLPENRAAVKLLPTCKTTWRLFYFSAVGAASL